MNGNRVWLYRRAANNRNNADVLLMQKRRLEAYAQEHNFEIVGRSGDRGEGRLAELPGLLKFKTPWSGRGWIFCCCSVSPAWERIPEKCPGIGGPSGPTGFGCTP